MRQWLAWLLILVMFLVGCNTPTRNAIAADNAKQFADETLPLKVAGLPLMELSSVDNIDKYNSIVDNLNNLIKILNEQGDLFDIEPFNPTIKGWEKASRLITEYGPLINNYNEVVNSAKSFKRTPNEDTRKKFYFASGKFAFESALIVGAVYYTASYQTVGIAYRSLGLNAFAFKCPSCVSVILSQAHWTVRTVLVEGSSQGAQTIIDKVEEMQNDGTIETLKIQTQKSIEKGKKVTTGLFNSTK